MQNTLSPEIMLPANDRAVISYLTAGYGHFVDALDRASDLIRTGKIEQAEEVIEALSFAALVTEGRAEAYLAGRKAALHPKYFDAEEPVRPGEPLVLLLTYSPATANAN